MARDRDDRAGRIPPHNFEAEMALLGAILTSNAAYDRVVGIVRPSDFADPRHGAIFAAIEQMRRQGRLADVVTLKGHFEATGELEQFGGPAYLARLAASVVSVINAEDYARTIKDRSTRRSLIMLAEKLVADAHEIRLLDTSADQIAAGAIGELTDLLGQAGQGGPQPIHELALEALARGEDAFKRRESGAPLEGPRTFIPALDAALGPIGDGRLVIIMARPGMGKTTLLKNLMGNAGAEGLDTVFFELEEEKDEVGAGAMALVTKISQSRQLSGDFVMEEYLQMREAAQEMERWPVHVDCSPGLSIAEMLARARILKPRMVLCDHLQITNGAAPGEEYRGPTEKIGAASTASKRMAKQLRCPVFMAAQLSRPQKGQEDRRPQLEDLRWAGEIEQDADIVLGLYRPHYYLSRVPDNERGGDWHRQWHETKNMTEIHILKRRGGPGAGKIVKAHYDPAVGVFSDWKDGSAQDQPPPAQYELVG